LSQDQFVERFGELLPPPPGGGRGGGRGGPGRLIGAGFFTAADLNTDGSLTRDELNGAFEKWAVDWDGEKSGALNEDKLREGLNAALPRPNFGGPGGGRGPGGPGGAGGGGGNMGGSWSTPIVVEWEHREELIVGYPFRLVSLDPRSGKQFWLSKGLGGNIYTTPLWGEGKLIATSGGVGGGSAIAVQPGGSGDVTEVRRLWRLERVKSALGSGVVHGGHFYSISQEGIAECFELSSGKTIWQERLSGPGAQTASWSSMLLADGKIYVPNKSGDVFVLRAAPKFEVLATNSVKEPTNASLAAADGALYLRTDQALWCIADSHR
jgi:hypothetical protein